jgi:hypothetical protein
MSDVRDARPPDHWLVLGVLMEDNTFIRKPGFTVEATTSPTLDARSPFHAELLDENGRVLLRAGIPLTTPCTDGPGPDPPYRLVTGIVPLPKATSLVHFVLDDVLIEEYRVPNGEPRISLTVVPDAGARGMTRVAWSSEHPEGIPLTHVVGYSDDDGKTWLAVGVPTSSNEIALDLDVLAGGENCRFSVKTTDGIHTVTATSDPIALPIKPCTAMILTPETGHELDRNTTLQLQGQGYWLEEHRPEFETLSWSSSLDGALGRGADIEVSGLQSGVHDIMLTAGEGERAGSTSIEVIVTDASGPRRIPS